MNGGLPDRALAFVDSVFKGSGPGDDFNQKAVIIRIDY
jgi:hypothetical protein